MIINIVSDLITNCYFSQAFLFCILGRNNPMNYRLFSKYIASFTHHNYCPNRSFKTKSQPFTGLGNGNTIRSPVKHTSLGDTKLGSIFGLKKDKAISGIDNEKIKGLINEESMNNEEKQRIKVYKNIIYFDD